MTGSTIHGLRSVARSRAVENPTSLRQSEIRGPRGQSHPNRWMAASPHSTGDLVESDDRDRVWPDRVPLTAFGGARCSHRLDRESDGHLDLDDDRFPIDEAAHDAMQH